MKVLAGDIGGTKTLLQIAEVDGYNIEVLDRSRFASQNFSNFDSLLHEYMIGVPTAVSDGISAACFGIAGPIQGTAQGSRTAKVTNLPWLLDEAVLQSQLGLSDVRLINDFYATACGIEALAGNDLAVLQSAPAQPRAPRLVVGAGTGLGAAQLMWCEGRYRALPSEGGHIHFAPTDGEQAALLQYMSGQHQRVSYERLVSGSGLANIYSFLVQSESRAADDHAALLAADDPAATIVEHARAGDGLAQRALRLFLSIYGAVVGDLALVNLPYGGIYIAGGIAPKLLAEMRDGTFINAFREKGRMSLLVEQFPLNIILNQDIGLLGATLAPTLV